MTKSLLFVAVLAVFVSLCLSAVTEKQINDYLEVCLDANNHKEKPGKEDEAFHHCTPWQNHACCKPHITKLIRKDNMLSMYNMRIDQCPQIKNLSDECRKHFTRDTCLYQCSPYLSPWFQPDCTTLTRQRFMHVPLCASDCNAWFKACKDDYTCSDNWGDTRTWNWTTHNWCIKPCKTFKEYYNDPKTFCEKIWNYSFKYTEGKHGEDCFLLWPNGTSHLNEKVARKHAKRALLINEALTKFKAELDNPKGVSSILKPLYTLLGYLLLLLYVQ